MQTPFSTSLKQFDFVKWLFFPLLQLAEICFPSFIKVSFYVQFPNTVYYVKVGKLITIWICQVNVRRFIGNWRTFFYKVFWTGFSFFTAVDKISVGCMISFFQTFFFSIFLLIFQTIKCWTFWKERNQVHILGRSGYGKFFRCSLWFRVSEELPVGPYLSFASFITLLK